MVGRLVEWKSGYIPCKLCSIKSTPHAYAESEIFLYKDATCDLFSFFLPVRMAKEETVTEKKPKLQQTT